MSEIRPPFTDVEVQTSDSGFYKDYHFSNTVISKIIIVALVIWAAAWPGNANSLLGEYNGKILGVFNQFYIVSAGIFFFFCLIIAIIPATGKRRLGKPDEKPEFSTFSWFSMMFGAGLGVGLMVYSTAEPMTLWGSNPDIVRGLVEANSEAALPSAFSYAYLHYGLHPWSMYVVVGLCMAYFSYRRDMPLTIRTALTPIFGKHINGAVGHIIDVLGVIATILGVAVTIGYGASQFIDGIERVLPMAWLSGEDGAPSLSGLIFALIVIMGLSTISAVSGVGKGIKYLSNLNLVLSIILLGTFVIFGSTLFSVKIFGQGLVEYFKNFFELSFAGYSTDTDVGKWQSGWTTFYWAWWTAFAPFVGLFLARISRGRTIREFVIGAVIAPAFVCFIWIAVLGGTAADYELSGVANGSIVGTNVTDMLFVSISYMLDGGAIYLLTTMCVVLVMTYLVTSADSGVLVVNTILSGGSDEPPTAHRVIWGIIITVFITVLLIAGKETGDSMNSVKNAMIIGALPFTVIMIGMIVSLIKALYSDAQRDKQGIATN